MRGLLLACHPKSVIPGEREARGKGTQPARVGALRGSLALVDTRALGPRLRGDDTLCILQRHAPALTPTLPKATFTPGPIVELRDIFFRYVPFEPCGFAFTTLSTKVRTFSTSAFSPKLALP